MGRLIDTDVIEAFIKNHSCCVGTDGELLTVGEDGKWNNLLEYIPTAYDVDKVVEELVCEWKEDAYGRWHTECNMLADNNPLEYTYCPYCRKKIKVVDDDKIRIW